jgi:hypothetical protein
MRMTCIAAALAATLLAPAVASSEGFSTYRAFDRWDRSSPIQYGEDMNERDQVVGSIWEALDGESVDRGFRWTPGTKRVELVQDFPSGAWATRLTAINDRGTAVGTGTIEVDGNAFIRRPLMLLPNGRRVALAHLGEPSQHSVAVDVNNANVAIGFVGDLEYYASYAVRWNPDGSVERLDVPAEVRRINDRGDIAGYWFNGKSYLREADGTLHTFSMTNLAHLGEDGTVAGRDGDGAVLWTLQGGLERLPMPPTKPMAGCYAASVNRHGQVVGTCTTETESRAVIWQRIGGEWAIGDLARLVKDDAIVLSAETWATKINDAGHILLDGAGRGEMLHPMILIPDKALMIGG